MKRRITALFLALALLCAILPTALFSASAASSGTCGTNLSWSYNSSTYTLTITGSGAMTDWDYYSKAPWYSYCSSIQSVSLPDGLTSIGNYAFSGCTGLTAISIPDGVTSIGDWAFEGCSGLTSITIGNGVTSIGTDAFCGCTGLTAISIPDGVTSIGEWAFADCTGLTAISIPDSVTSICWGAFCDCTGLTAISIPSGVTSIGDSAFYGCTGLTAITIPDSVTSIGREAFVHCTGLTNITIPDSVTSIGREAFYGCTGLTAISIPDSVTSICWGAFSGCTGLTDVYYPGTEEEWNAIDIDDENDPLVNATIHFGPKGGTCGENLEWSFDEATGTLTITGSGAMTDWDYYSKAPWYSYCSSIQSVSLPDGLTSIGNYAFSGCTGLTAIAIPDGVTSIGEWAFYDCSSLTSVTIGNSVTSIGYGAFYDCTGLTAISIPDGVTSIGEWAFAACTGLTAISIPDSVTSIGEYAFSLCTSLTSVTIPDSVTSIGRYAFSDCSSLTSVTIGNSVTSIGYAAFYGCSRLTSVYFCGDAPELDGGVFRLWDELKEEYIAIPGLTLYYIEGKTGWTTPTWNGYPTATWKPIEPDKPCDGGASCPGKVFTDMPKPSNWAHAGIDFCVENGLFAGTSATTFSPDGNMTRAMLVTVLYRLEGQPAVTASNPFSDVANGQWFTNAIIWAAGNGVVNGVGDGKFDPDANITREQMAAILYRYAQKKGFDTSARADLKTYPDYGEISAYARDALSWANVNGLINGTNGTNGQTILDPQGNATRAQVAAILMRYVKNIVEAE